MEGKRAARRGQKAERPLRPATIAGVCRTLSKLLKDAGYPERVSYKVPKQPYSWIKTPAEVHRFLAACSPEWFRVAAALACYSGLRRGEVAALRREDLDLDRGTILVRRSHGEETTKGKRHRFAPLPPELATLLKPWLLAHRGPHVVTIAGRPLTPKTDLATRTRRACKLQQVYITPDLEQGIDRIDRTARGLPGRAWTGSRRRW